MTAPQLMKPPKVSPTSLSWILGWCAPGLGLSARSRPAVCDSTATPALERRLSNTPTANSAPVDELWLAAQVLVPWVLTDHNQLRALALGIRALVVSARLAHEPFLSASLFDGSFAHTAAERTQSDALAHATLQQAKPPSDFISARQYDERLGAI